MRGRALLIGCSTFDHSRLRPLSSPPLDVRLLSGVLSSPGGIFAEDDIECLWNPPHETAREKITELLLSARRGETVLIYYSGHGTTYQDSLNNLFLAMRDTDPDRLPITSVDTGFINTVIAGMVKTVQVVLLLDACSTGAYDVDLRLTPQLYVIGAAAAGSVAPDGTVAEASPFATSVARTLLGLDNAGPGPITTDDIYQNLDRHADLTPFRSASSRGTVELIGPRPDGLRADEEDFRREMQFARLPEAREADRGLARLPAADREAARDLLVVPEDSPVSERWITAWWAAHDGRRLAEPEALLEELIRRRLIDVKAPARDGHGRLVGLRKAARAVLSVDFTGERRRSAYDSMVRTAARELLPSGEPDAWWLLPVEPETLWGRMPRHLEKAGRLDDADRLRCDLRWIALRTRRTGSVAESLAELETISDRRPAAGPLRRALLRARHLLDPAADRESLRPVLLSRIPPEGALAAIGDAFAAEVTGARITAAWPLPDEPHPAQLVLWRAREEFPDGNAGLPLSATSSTRTLLTVGAAGIERWDPATGDRLPPWPRTIGMRPQCSAVTDKDQFLAVGGELGIRLLPLGSDDRAWHGTGPEAGRVLACATAGSQLLAVGANNIAQLLTFTDEGALGRKIGTTEELLGHSDVVNCGAMAGHLIATGSDDRTIRLWTDRGVERGEPLRTADGAILCCTFTPGLERVIGGTDSGSVLEWIVTGSDPQLLYRHAGAVRCLVADPQGTWLASGSDDGSVRVTSRRDGLAGGYGRVAVLSGHRGAVTDCVTAADGSWLATSGEDGTIRVWDPAAPAPATRPARTEPARFCVPSAGGTWFLSGGSSSRTLHRWERSKADAPVEIGEWAVTAAAISADDRLVLAGSADGSLRLYVGAELVRVFPRAGSAVTACLFAADGGWVAAGQLTGEIFVHSLLDDSGPIRHVIDRTAVRALAETSGGKLVAFSRKGTRGVIPVRDPGGEVSRHVGRDPLVAVHSDPAGTFVLTRADGTVTSGTLESVFIDSPLRLRPTAEGIEPVHFTAAAADRTGGRLVTADSTRSVRVWTAAGEELAELPLNQPVIDCRWLDDSTIVAAGDAGVHLLTFHEK
jgi:WD40 repeat protein